MNAEALAQQLLLDEGLRLKPYRCTAGKLTIGVGRNLDDTGISEAEARLLLVGDIARVWAELAAALPWLRGAPEEVQQVLTNMAFNLGAPGLLRFKNTLLPLAEGRYEAAAAEMLDSLWARQVGPRAERLAGRIRALA